MLSFLNKRENDSYDVLLAKYKAVLEKYTELEARVTALEMFHDKYKKQVRRRLNEIEEEAQPSNTGVLVPV